MGQLQSAIATAADAVVPFEAKQAVALMGSEIARIEAQLSEIDANVIKQQKANPLS